MPLGLYKFTSKELPEKLVNPQREIASLQPQVPTYSSSQTEALFELYAGSATVLRTIIWDLQWQRRYHTVILTWPSLPSSYFPIFIPLHFLVELLFTPVRDFDVSIEQQVFLCGEVVKEHVVLHTHPHVLPDNFLVGSGIFAIHKDSTWWRRKQSSQNRSMREK